MSNCVEDRGRKRQVLSDLTNLNGKRILSSSPNKSLAVDKHNKYGRTSQSGAETSLFEKRARILKKDIPSLPIRSNDVNDENLSTVKCTPRSGDAAVHEYEGAILCKSSLDYIAAQYSQGRDSSSDAEEDIIREGSDSDTADLIGLGSQTGECSQPLASSQGNVDIQQMRLHKEDESDFNGLIEAPSNRFPLSASGLEGLNVLGTCNDANVGDNIFTDKECSCSFCLKAAHIWTDLYLQDARGRLAELKKSTRYARTFGERCYNFEPTNVIVQDNSKRTSNMETDLMQHWRKLFLRTEGLLIDEGRELGSLIGKLKEVRQSCKRNLETFGMASNEKS